MTGFFEAFLLHTNAYKKFYKLNFIADIVFMLYKINSFLIKG